MVTELDYEALTAAFPREAIKQRSGGGGRMLSYIDAATVIRRLNRTCPTWNFEVLREWQDGQLHKVHGKLTIPPLGSREHMGVQVVSGKPGTEDVETKGAVSDCIKRCAVLFGVGIELYGDDHDHQSDAPRSTQSAPAPSNAQSVIAQPTAPPATNVVYIASSQVDTIRNLQKQMEMGEDKFVKGLERNYGKSDVMDLTAEEGTSLIKRLMDARANAQQPSTLPNDRATQSRQ